MRHKKLLWDPKKHSTAQTRRREECQPNLEKTSQEIKPKSNQTFADYPEDYPEDCPEDSSDIRRFGGGDATPVAPPKKNSS